MPKPGAGEELVQHSEALYHALVETELDMVFVISRDYKVQYANALTARLLNQDPQEVTGGPLEALFPPETAAALVERIQSVLTTGLPVFNEHLVRLAGREVWLTTVLIPVRAEGREVDAVLGVSRDTSQRKRIEDDLYSSNLMLHLILDNIPQRVFWKNRDLTYRGCNRPFALDAGLDDVDLIVGKTDFDLSWKDTAELYNADDRRVMESGEPKINYEEPQSRPDGSSLWLRTSKIPLRDRDGQVIGLLGTYEDITERKQIEADLRRRADELEAVYQTALEVNQQMDLSAALSAIVERSARLIDIPMGGLYLLTPDGSKLQLSVVYGMDKGLIGRTLRLGEGLSGRVAAEGKPLTVEDYQNWEYQSEVYKDRAFRRMLGVPLKVGERVIGVINLSDATRTGPFSEDQIRLVSLFADQAAIAVEKARMLEAERQKSRLLARSNALIAALSQVAVRLEATLDPLQIMETVGSELKQLGVTILIARFEQGSQNLVVRYTSIPPSALEQATQHLGVKLIGFQVPEAIWPVGRLVEQRRPLFMRDPFFYLATGLPDLPDEEIEAILEIAGANRTTGVIYLPLVMHENALGMLAVWGSDLHEDDVNAFTVFANQVAVALENARLYNEIQKQAILDDMTGLYNRRGFFTLALQHMKLAQRMKKDLLLIFVDVDGMKQINDTFGHKLGDQTLIDAAELLKKTFRSADIIARMGGDEFAVLAVLPSRSNLDNLQARLNENLAAFNARKQREYLLSISTGMVEWISGDKPLTLDELLSKADARMYTQKREKKTNP